MLSEDFRTFLRVMIGMVLLAILAAVGTLGVFGLIDLRDHIWPRHPLQCVAAHDEFHQTDNGIKVRVCTSYQRR